MSDEEYWEDVAASLQDRPLEEDVNDENLQDVFTFPDPCGVCGEYGACGYDSEGRALVHAEGLRKPD